MGVALDGTRVNFGFAVGVGVGVLVAAGKVTLTVGVGVSAGGGFAVGASPQLALDNSTMLEATIAKAIPACLTRLPGLTILPFT